MSIRKPLGGDRLGSGAKIAVELHNYGRSTHDLGYLWRSTMAAGTLVPFMCQIAQPGDTFDIELQCDMKTHPTVGPLFASGKVQLDLFQAPLRLYNALMHNNMVNVGKKMADVKFPTLTLTAKPTPDGVKDLDNSQVNPSSLLAYLGIRGVGVTEEETTRKFNAIPTLAYWEIYKQYYSNKQEEIGAYLHTPQEALTETVELIQLDAGNVPQAPADDLRVLLHGNTITVDIVFQGAVPKPDEIYFNTVEYGSISIARLTTEVWSNQNGTIWAKYDVGLGPITVLNWHYRNSADMYSGMPQVHTFALSNIDDMRMKLLQAPTVSAFDINSVLLKPYQDITGASQGINNTLSNQEGLALKTYQSDLFNNWLSTEWIDGPGGINEITAISTAGGSFKIDALNLANKLYNLLNRIAVSGGTMDDWQEATYGVATRGKATSPIYHGGLIKELVFQEVISNAESADAVQPLGTLGGRGVLSKKHKGGKAVIKVDEPSVLIGIISITPRVDYSQGNDWHVHLKNMDELHKPELDEIGFQDLITEQMAWWDTNWDDVSNVWRTRSAGKQPAWINYMTNTNKVLGNFAIESNEMFMTFNRRYEPETIEGGVQIGDLTTYIDPAKFNHVFAQTSRDAQNYWAQIAVDITARRIMSAKVMPNL